MRDTTWREKEIKTKHGVLMVIGMKTTQVDNEQPRLHRYLRIYHDNNVIELTDAEAFEVFNRYKESHI